MSKLMKILIAFTILCLAACSNETVSKNIIPDRVEKEVNRLLQATVEKDSSALALHADEVLNDTSKLDKLLNAAIVGTELKSANLYDYKYEKSASLRYGKSGVYTISYLIETDIRMVLAIFEIHESSDGLILYDISFQPARKKKVTDNNQVYVQ